MAITANVPIESMGAVIKQGINNALYKEIEKEVRAAMEPRIVELIKQLAEKAAMEACQIRVDYSTPKPNIMFHYTIKEK